MPQFRRSAPIALAAALVVVACKGQQGASEVRTTGERLYLANCATCHGSNGKGLGEYPTIVGKADILGGDYARTVIAEGRNKMPAFGTKLSQQQIDEIIDYVATLHG
jgi:mono/diheme cytochrome c family protein